MDQERWQLRIQGLRHFTQLFLFHFLGLRLSTVYASLAVFLSFGWFTLINCSCITDLDDRDLGFFMEACGQNQCLMATKAIVDQIQGMC
jgi:hypothetical protein